MYASLSSAKQKVTIQHQQDVMFPTIAEYEGERTKRKSKIKHQECEVDSLSEKVEKLQ